MLPFSNEASLIYVDSDLTIIKRMINARIVRVVWRLWYKHHMSIPASASFQIKSCPYHNLDNNINKGKSIY